ncbi:MAG: sialidase family protein [Dehalococcoidia bacterium]
MGSSKLEISTVGEGVAAARPGQMYAWPGLTRTSEGTLTAAVSERKHHVCPYGRIVMVRSADGGATWDLPQEIFNSEMDDRHPSLATLPDGTLVCSFLTVNFWMSTQHIRDEWRLRAARVTERALEETLGDWLIRSFDGGQTWEQTPHRMPHGASLHASPYAMANGTLACFGYEMVNESMQMYFYTSADQGATWAKTGAMPSGDVVTGSFAWAPWQLTRGGEVKTTPWSMRSITETSSGRLLAMLGGPEGYLFQADSGDGGRTWSEPKQTPMWGFPPHLLRMESGALLCTYGHRREPWSIRGVLSYDDGKTWDVNGIITIDEWDDNPDAGYPVASEIGPGEISVVYYCHREPNPSAEIAGSSGLLVKRLRVY